MSIACFGAATFLIACMNVGAAESVHKRSAARPGELAQFQETCVLRISHWLICTLVALVCAAASFAAGAQARDGLSSLTEYSSLSGDVSTAFAGNDRGGVDQSRHNFRLRFRRTVIEAPNGAGTEATDVAGVVVGAYNAPAGRAFAWTRNVGFVDLEGVLTASFSLAHAVNECGQIVGELDNHAVRWNSFTEIEDLGTLGGLISAAHGINDRGDVVGLAQVDVGGPVTPFLWTEEQGMRQIVECDGRSGVATAINNAREVVGACDDAMGQPQAFFWSAQTGRIDLDLPGFLNSSASGINERGEVVGNAVGSDFTPVVGFKWMPRKRRVVFLRDLGDDFSIARDINQVGWIVGDAVDNNDTRRAVVWLTPKRGFAVDPSLGASSLTGGSNDLGSVAGVAIPANRVDVRAILWEPPSIIAHVLSKLGARRCLRPNG